MKARATALRHEEMEEITNYHMLCLQNAPTAAPIIAAMHSPAATRFYLFLLRYNYRDHAEALEPLLSPSARNAALEAAARYHRPRLFHLLLIPLRDNPPPTILPLAISYHSTSALDILLRYATISLTTAHPNGLNCVHLLINHQLYHYLRHFYHLKDLWLQPWPHSSPQPTYSSLPNYSPLDHLRLLYRTTPIYRHILLKINEIWHAKP